MSSETITLKLRCIVARQDWSKTENGDTIKIWFGNYEQRVKVLVVEKQPGYFIGTISSASMFRSTFKRLKSEWLRNELARLTQNTESWEQHTIQKMLEEKLENCKEFLCEYHFDLL